MMVFRRSGDAGKLPAFHAIIFSTFLLGTASDGARLQSFGFALIHHLEEHVP